MLLMLMQQLLMQQQWGQLGATPMDEALEVNVVLKGPSAEVKPKELEGSEEVPTSPGLDAPGHAVVRGLASRTRGHGPILNGQATIKISCRSRLREAMQMILVCRMFGDQI